MATKDDLFPSNWIKAEQVADADQVVTIVGIKSEKTKEGRTQRVLSFKEFPGKFLGLNKTNWNTIAKVTGEPDDDNWIGRRITLFATEVQSPTGEMVLGIRVRTRAPAAATAKKAQAAPAEELDGEEITEDRVPF